MKNKVVGLAGNFNQPSRTYQLTEEIVNRTAHAFDLDSMVYNLSALGQSFPIAQSVQDLDEQAQIIIKEIIEAEILVISVPTWNAGYPGMFKHLFDFVEQTALVDVPVLLAASGGSERHALVLEHQLRPLFSFFQAQTLPIGVYATDKDFTPQYTVSSQQLRDRIVLAVARALPILEWAPAKGRRAQAIKEKSAQANQQLGINKQVEQAEILPSVAVPDLSSAEARLHPQTTQSSLKNHPSVA